MQTHPTCQHPGLGSELLSRSLPELEAIEGADAIAAHFGATPWLLKLWRSNGAQLAPLSH